jgi:hypothetical protein
VYTVKPYRILVSTKQWDDGEWVGIVSFNDEHDCFVFSDGVYNKMRGSCSVAKTARCSGTSAAEISREVVTKMVELKSRHPRDGYHLNPAPQKRGPKK